MSLVEPRTAFTKELARHERLHRRKLGIMPGVACLWQVNGRNAITDFNKWVRMDLDCIEN